MLIVVASIICLLKSTEKTRVETVEAMHRNATFAELYDVTSSTVTLASSRKLSSIYRSVTREHSCKI